MRSDFEGLFQTSTVTACVIAWAWDTVTGIFGKNDTERKLQSITR